MTKLGVVNLILHWNKIKIVGSGKKREGVILILIHSHSHSGPPPDPASSLSVQTAPVGHQLHPENSPGVIPVLPSSRGQTEAPTVEFYHPSTDSETSEISPGIQAISQYFLLRLISSRS